MIFIYLWLASTPPTFKSSMCDFVLKLLGTFPHTLEDTALFVRPDYRPREHSLERVTMRYMFISSLRKTIVLTDKSFY